MKAELRQIQRDVADANNSSLPEQNRLLVYKKALDSLNSLVKDLNTSVDGVRLIELRSVRNYQQAVAKYSQNIVQLQDNQSQLEKAQSAVSNVIWFLITKSFPPVPLSARIQKPINSGFSMKMKSGTVLIRTREDISKLPTSH